MFPSVEIRHLLAVIALAEELNFRHAGGQIAYPQPAVAGTLHEQSRHLEPAYDYSFAGGHQQSIGMSVGLLIGIP